MPGVHAAKRCSGQLERRNFPAIWIDETDGRRKVETCSSFAELFCKVRSHSRKRFGRNSSSSLIMRSGAQWGFTGLNKRSFVSARLSLSAALKTVAACATHHITCKLPGSSRNKYDHCDAECGDLGRWGGQVISIIDAINREGQARMLLCALHGAGAWYFKLATASSARVHVFASCYFLPYERP